jgi:thrombospondin type 3 repeat protein
MPTRLRATLTALLTTSVLFAGLATTASAYYEPVITIGGYSFSNGGQAITGHTSGLCTDGGTIGFHYSGTTFVSGEDGPFEESGTVTVEKVDGVLRVTDLESTFSMSSSRAQVEGRRYGVSTTGTRSWGDAQNRVRCGGTTDADRYVEIRVDSFYETTKFDIFGDRFSIDRGYTTFDLNEWAAGSPRSINPYQPGSGGYFWVMFASDQDWDGSIAYDDNCQFVFNPGQEDRDGGDEGDACDGDYDDDDHYDATQDNCPDVYNPDQQDSDRDGTGDACDTPDPPQDPDRDGDGTYDSVDNCPDVPGSQLDSDGDGRGDVCDPDDDADTVADGADNCPLTPNATQRDSDRDGRGDACDGTFDSSDGHATGGGFLVVDGRKAHLSFSARSTAGVLEGLGKVVDGRRDIRLLDVTGLRQDGSRAVIVGNARVDGAATTYRLEVVDGGEPTSDTVELEAGGYRLAGRLAGGNLQVH